MVQPFVINENQKNAHKKGLVLFVVFVVLTYAYIIAFINKTAQFSLVNNVKLNEDTEFASDVDVLEGSAITLQLSLDKNQSLSTLLKQNKVDRQDILDLESKLKQQNKKLKNHSKIVLDLVASNDKEGFFNISALSAYSPDNLSHIKVVKNAQEFVVEEIIIQLVKSIIKIKAPINGSLFSSLKSLGVPLNTVNELISAYSHQIDFQRQVKNADFIEFLIEKYTTDKDDFSHYGNILLAKLNLSNQVYDLYRYTGSSSGYFSQDGKSFRRNLLKTPVKAARISSHFGNRVHPILGYTKMHKGIDFAAPKGTPIYSAGDGVITEVGTKGGYGNYIKVKHSSSLSTLYAHLSKVHKGIKVGSKIKQGSVIAYVGSTGSSTAPHLHYEVHIAGRPVNPLSIKTLPDSKLSGEHLNKFIAARRQLLDIDKFLSNNESYRFSKEG